jgi:hypothetical protein
MDARLNKVLTDMYIHCDHTPRRRLDVKQTSSGEYSDKHVATPIISFNCLNSILRSIFEESGLYEEHIAKLIRSDLKDLRELDWHEYTYRWNPCDETIMPPERILRQHLENIDMEQLCLWRGDQLSLEFLLQYRKVINWKMLELHVYSQDRTLSHWTPEFVACVFRRLTPGLIRHLQIELELPRRFKERHFMNRRHYAAAVRRFKWF